MVFCDFPDVWCIHILVIFAATIFHRPEPPERAAPFTFAALLPRLHPLCATGVHPYPLLHINKVARRRVRNIQGRCVLLLPRALSLFATATVPSRYKIAVIRCIFAVIPPCRSARPNPR